MSAEPSINPRIVVVGELANPQVAILFDHGLRKFTIEEGLEFAELLKGTCERARSYRAAAEAIG